MRCFNLLILLAPMAMAACTPSEDDVKNELLRFEGAWQAVAFQHGDGAQASEEEVKNIRLVIEGSEFKLTGKDYTISGTFTIDPTKTPKTIDVLITSKDGRATKFLGIYQIQGERRKSCFSLEAKERPTQFTSETGYFGFVWKRK